MTAIMIFSTFAVESEDLEGFVSYMEPRGRANGLDYMLTRFVPVMKWVGVCDAAIHAILEENPARVFSIWD